MTLANMATITIVIPTPHDNPRINGKLLSDSEDSLNFSAAQSDFGSFLSSEQVKQMFSDEQVAHWEGQAEQVDPESEDFK